MSSNTLRGIGQEGEGEGESGDVSGPPLESRASESTGGARGGRTPEGDTKPGSGDHSGDGASPPQETRKARALDAPVPGTRSLDASVPDAQPSLDAKIPALAATLLGVAAPSKLSVAAPSTLGVAPLSNSAGGRDQGTVQGRDIHLPVEAQHVAGVRAIAGVVIGESGATPELIDRSEPTLADPIRTAAIAQATTEYPLSHHADLSSHAPWYDQEPVGAHVYEEEKPSFVGRAAIGVAVAAGVSVVLFAIVRLYAQNGASDEPETPRSPLSYKSAALPPPVPPAPLAQPAPEPTLGTTQRPTVGDARATANPFAPRNVPREATSAVQGNPAMVPSRARPPARAGVLPQPTGPTSHAPPSPRSGFSTQSALPATKPSIPGTTPPPIMPPSPTGNAASAAPKLVAEPPTLSTPTRATAPRAKPVYDPDSTLPLNAD